MAGDLDFCEPSPFSSFSYHLVEICFVVVVAGVLKQTIQTTNNNLSLCSVESSPIVFCTRVPFVSGSIQKWRKLLRNFVLCRKTFFQKMLQRSGASTLERQPLPLPPGGIGCVSGGSTLDCSSALKTLATITLPRMFAL